MISRLRFMTGSVWFAGLLATLALPGAAGAQGGSLEHDFGRGGRALATTGLTEPSPVYELQVDAARAPDGNLYVASDERPGLNVIVSFNAGGEIRRTFGQNGRLRISLAGNRFELDAITVDPRGNLLIAGNLEYGESPVFVFRVLPDGSLDTSFGAGGTGYTQETVETAIPGYRPHGTDSVRDIAVDPSGRIVVGGVADLVEGYCDDFQSGFVVRFDQDGSPDTGFGSNGAIVFPLSSMAREFGMVLDPKGAPMVFGQDLECRPVDPPRSWLARVTTAGNPDPGFGSEGRIETGSLTAVAVDRYGRILTLSGDGRVHRYSTAGSLEAGFRRNATKAMPEEWTPGGLAVTGRNEVLVTGSEAYGPRRHRRKRLVLTRIDSTGRVVRAFGRDGLVRSGLGRGWNTTGRQVLLDGSGHVLVAGAAWNIHELATLFLFSYKL